MVTVVLYEERDGRPEGREYPESYCVPEPPPRRHGVGLECHEPPLLDFKGPELLEGELVTIEPGLYYPGLGACRIEDVVQVTDRRPKLLSHYHYDWEIR